MSNYVIEICVDSWESKWLNVVARFKTPAHYSKQVVYCTAVSRYVTKSGRKTIPPWFVFATSGYGVEEETRKNWEKVSRSKLLRPLRNLTSTRGFSKKNKKKHTKKTG